MSTDRVMLLIDADNVSVDVMEQAVSRLLDEYGALHVRRAYCTAESAVKHQTVFKRLSIKPMVNLAAGKNSTDIALAVDAIDLVLAERPDVVVIASSDSDFAPLVARLREKGCTVRGIGQEGKTGDETRSVYDSFDVLAHRTRAASTSRTAARKTTRRRSAEPATVDATETSAAAAAAKADAVPESAEAVVAAPATKTRSRRSSTKKTEAEAVPETPVARKSTRSPRTRKSAASAVPAAVAEVAEVAAAEPPPPPAMLAPPAVAELLRALPALADGETLELQKAAEQLRRARLLSRSSSALKLFGRFPDWFDLQPPAHPKRVTLRPAG